MTDKSTRTRFDGFIMIDVETTGLDERSGYLLELGMAHYDKDFHLFDVFQSLILTRETKDYITTVWPDGDYAKEMHKKSGLIDDLLALSDTDIVDVNTAIVQAKANDWLNAQGVSEDVKLPYTGSSVHFDMSWINSLMPDLATRFGYRTVDASSFREYAYIRNRELGEKVDNDCNPRNAHRVLPDIMDSMDLFKSLQKHGVII